jgi:hypothetical protein
LNRESLIKIIKMFKDGIINEEEAADLIEAISTEENEGRGKQKFRKLVIHVVPKTQNGDKIDLSIPLSLASGFLKKFATEKNLDLDVDSVVKDGIHVEDEDEIVDIHLE